MKEDILNILFPSSDITVLIFMLFVFFLSGIVKGFLGIGLPAAAMALLTLVIPPAHAISLLVIPILFTNLTQFSRAKYRIESIKTYWLFAIAIILSIGLLNELFKEKWSVNLAGGILESFGRLFKNRVQLFVYPWHNTKSMELVTVENFKTPENWQYFYQHLLQNQRIRPVGVGDPSLLAMTSRKTMKLIESGGSEWEQWVPEEAHAMVRRMQAGS